MGRTAVGAPQSIGVFVKGAARSLWLFLLLTRVPFAGAQQADEAAVRGWIESEWNSAVASQLPPDTVFAFVEDVQEVPPPGQLEALRAAVKGHPDHPEQGDLEIYERRIKNGPDRTRYKVWYHGPDLWRISQSLEYDAEGTTYWDTARDGDLVWGMTNDQLTLVSAEHEAEVRRHYAERGDQIMREAWTALVHANFGFGWFRESSPAVVSVVGDEWVARAVNSAGVIGEWRGRWDDELGRGFVSKLVFIGKEDGELPNRYEWTFDGWSFDPVLGVWIASSMQHDIDGRHKRRLLKGDSQPVAEAGVKVVAAIPDVAGSDPVRGEVTVSRMNDLRPGADTIQQIGEDRDVIHAESAENQRPPGSGVLRWIGWATLVVLVAGLLWVRSSRKPVG